MASNGTGDDREEALKVLRDNIPLTPSLQEGDDDPLKRMLEYNHKWAGQADASLLAKNAKGQEPKVLWLGCADSRIPESLLCGTMPGEVFVHRNIAACFHPGDTSATAVLAYAINTLGVTNIVVVSHYGCGGIHAAMGMAKSRSHAHMNNDSPSAPLPGADDELGQGAIERWLAPTRALAVAQLRAAGPTGDLDDEESHRQLVRTHCCAQVSNIESSAIVQRAEKDGKKVNVYGWVYDVATGCLVDLEV